MSKRTVNKCRNRCKSNNYLFKIRIPYQIGMRYSKEEEWAVSHEQYTK